MLSGDSRFWLANSRETHLKFDAISFIYLTFDITNAVKKVLFPVAMRYD